MTGRPEKKTESMARKTRKLTEDEWLVLYTLWLRKFIGITRRRTSQAQLNFVKGTKWGQRIGNRYAEIQLFCKWIGVPLNLWINETWRDLIELRYSWGTKPLIRILGKEWRRALDRRLVELKTKSRNEPLSIESKLPRAFRLVARQYELAKTWKELNRYHPLHGPVSDPSFIAMLQFGDPWLAEYQLDRYVTIPKGSHEYLIGAIIYTLHRFEDGYRGREDQSLPQLHEGKPWPLPIDRSALKRNNDCVEIERRYRNHLRFPLETLSQIDLAHTRLKVSELAPRGDPRLEAITLAASLVEEYDPEVFAEYLKQFQRMRREVLRPFIQAHGDPRNLDRLWRARFLPFLTALREDPLFSCITYDVMENSLATRSETQKPGRRSLPVEGRTAAFAVWKLQPYFPLASGLTPRDALKDFKPTAHYVRSVIPLGRQRGLYNVLAPYLSALFRYQRTADQIKGLSRKYKSTKEMEELDAWTSEIVEEIKTKVKIEHIRKRLKPH